MEMESNKKEEQRLARQELWRRGSLSWKLDKTQKELYDLFYNSNHKIMTWLLSRRQGKSFTLCILALEQCFKTPNSVVKFVSPTKLQVQTNVRPIFRSILEDCPEDIKPEFKKQDYIYYFANGSEIQLAGCDGGHAEKLRGGDSHLWFIDEAGSCSDLNNIIKSILLPTTLITKGRGILASTPPKEADHEFLNYIEDAEMKGCFIKKTIDDNPRITPQQRADLIEELGGVNSEEARRELFCEIIKDSTTSVIPEFDDKLVKDIVREWPRPPFFDSYEGMDTGGKDFTAVIFGYYDFRADKIIIEDEVIMDFRNKNETLESLCKQINAKEVELWTNPISLEYKPVYNRVSDIDYVFTQEIYNHSKKLFPKDQAIDFRIVNKDSNEAMINNLRILLTNKKIVIHPKCVTLIRHLKNARWDKNKNKLARSADDSHYDALDALKYFVRTIDFRKNPYPADYQMNMQNVFLKDPRKFYENSNNQLEMYKKLFGYKPKKRY